MPPQRLPRAPNDADGIHPRRQAVFAGRRRPRAGGRRRRRAQRDRSLAVDWVAEEAFAPLVRLHPRRAARDSRGAATLAPSPARPRATWREFAAFRRELRRERYDAVIDLQEQVKGALLAAGSHAARATAPTAPASGEPVATLLHDVHHADRPTASTSRTAAGSSPPPRSATRSTARRASAWSRRRRRRKRRGRRALRDARPRAPAAPTSCGRRHIGGHWSRHLARAGFADAAALGQ